MHFNSPLSSSKADSLIGLLKLDEHHSVIDVGCGLGEFLIRVGERYGCRGVGVDTQAHFLSSARATARGRVSPERITYEECDIREYQSSDLFDCGICLGATHAYSMNAPAYPVTLEELGKIVRPGGKLLIGEGYWAQSPAAEYVEFLGDPVGVYRTHVENVELAIEAGLDPLYVTTSSLDEWDDFEWRHNMKKKKTARRLKPEAAASFLDANHKWRMAYLRWGRGTMGFGFYLFEKPA